MTVARLLPFAIAMTLIACKPAAQDDSAGTSATAAPAPAATKVHKPVSTATNWQCGDLSVTTRFDDSSLESMTLSHSGTELSLKSVATDEGVRFVDAAGDEFWSRPGNVSLILAGKAPTSCKKLR